MEKPAKGMSIVQVVVKAIINTFILLLYSTSIKMLKITARATMLMYGIANVLKISSNIRIRIDCER